MSEVFLLSRVPANHGPTYVCVGPSTAHEALQASDQLTPALALPVVLNATRPVVLAGADEDLLRVGGHCPIQRLVIVDRKTLGHRRGRGTGACRFGTRFGHREWGRDLEGNAGWL